VDVRGLHTLIRSLHILTHTHVQKTFHLFLALRCSACTHTHTHIHTHAYKLTLKLTHTEDLPLVLEVEVLRLHAECPGGTRYPEVGFVVVVLGGHAEEFGAGVGVSECGVSAV
jgi:hypothetical protein